MESQQEQDIEYFLQNVENLEKKEAEFYKLYANDVKIMRNFQKMYDFAKVNLENEHFLSLLNDQMHGFDVAEIEETVLELFNIENK